MIELKKMVSAIHECGDKFNWLDDRYKQERKDIDAIFQNVNLVQKNISQKVVNTDTKLTAFIKESEETITEMKAKVA